MPHVDNERGAVELCVAYVGTAGAGKTTTLTAIRNVLGAARTTEPTFLSYGGDRLMMFDWTPERVDALEPLSVRVRLTGVAGEAKSEDALADVLREADVAVIVLDASAASLARNQAAVRRVLGALGALARDVDALSLVVQLNRTDLPDAMNAPDVLDAVGLSDAVCFTSRALSGDGVLAPLEAAVREAAKRFAASPQLAELERSPAGAARIHALVRDTQKALASLPERMADAKDVEARIAGVVLALGAKLDALDAKLQGPMATLSAKLDGLERELNGVRDLVKASEEARERDLRVLRRALDEQTQGTRKLVHQTGEVLAQKLAGLESATTSFHGAEAQHAAQIVQTAETQISALRIALEHSFEAANDQIGKLRSDVEGLEQKLARGDEGLRREVQTLSVTLDELNGELRQQKKKGWWRSAGA